MKLSWLLGRFMKKEKYLVSPTTHLKKIDYIFETENKYILKVIELDLSDFDVKVFQSSYLFWLTQGAD